MIQDLLNFIDKNYIIYYMENYSYIYLLHILFVGPLFIYLGIAKQNVPDIVFNGLIVMGIFVSLYHGYKLYNFYQMKKLSESV